MVGTLRLFALILLAVAGAAEADVRLLSAPSNRLDVESLQRGARDFVNYCLTCHSARYMQYNRLVDLGLTEKQIQDNLMFASDKVGSTMTVAMTPAEGVAWFGAAPPDLTVEARVRGKDWLYSYLLAFYRDDKSSTGWNNLVFPKVAMPHVLWGLSGEQKLVETPYDDIDKADAAAIANRGLVSVDAAAGGKYTVTTLALGSPGTLSPESMRRSSPTWSTILTT